MTRDDILAASGRELDGLVAQAKGWKHVEVGTPEKHALPIAQGCPPWSALAGARAELPLWHRDWHYAGPLLEEMAADGYLIRRLHHREPAMWCWARNGENVVEGSTPQEAIARAYCVWRLKRCEQP